MFMDKMAPGILRLSVMDNDIDLFEGQYPVPQGVSYNTYLIEDDRLCLLDTVDARKQEEWLAGLDEVLAGRKLDYLVISHMEPDHAGSIAALCARQPQVKLVANAKTFGMLDQFTGDHPLTQERVTVGEALGLCQNPAKNERGELAAAEVERARRALRTYVFGAGALERTGNSLRVGEGEGDGRR